MTGEQRREAVAALIRQRTGSKPSALDIFLRSTLILLLKDGKGVLIGNILARYSRHTGKHMCFLNSCDVMQLRSALQKCFNSYAETSATVLGTKVDLTVGLNPQGHVYIWADVLLPAIKPSAETNNFAIGQLPVAAA